MKRIILPILVMIFFITTLHAQKKQKVVTGYAITAPEKGQTGWREVRLVDMKTGEELKTIYKGTDELPLLNARTGKPIVKKDAGVVSASSAKKIVNLDQQIETTANNIQVYKVDPDNKIQLEQTSDSKVQGTSSAVGSRLVFIRTGVQNTRVQKDKPFATNSAAIAYDKKHERLYYTPMNINQLRYIDLGSKSPAIYYFEDEAFGNAGLTGDQSNQITRMVIGSNGDGYALSNDANHLINFTTGKKTVITDLGQITDDASNKVSIHSRNGYGGDMIADKDNNLYLVTAGHNVFKINIDSRIATHMGAILGLPKGFGTNGALVEEGSKIIVCSSESTEAYYRFDLSNLQASAEKIQPTGTVFNASDLANGNLAFDKKKKEKKTDPVVTQPVVVETIEKRLPPTETVVANSIAVYPNPVTNGVVRLSFSNQPAGRYQIQLLDLSGKLLSSQEVNINGKTQIEEFRLPALAVKGNYLLTVSNESKNISISNKLVVQ